MTSMKFNEINLLEIAPADGRLFSTPKKKLPLE
jgi:hypothetical protein